MKAAILGTADYHATMQQIATRSLKRMGSYFVQVADGEFTVQLPSVNTLFVQATDIIIQTITEIALTNCNPRSPYLFFAWMLVGSDNPYRTNQYVDNPRIHKWLASQYLRIVFGDYPHPETNQVYMKDKPSYVAHSIAIIVTSIVTFQSVVSTEYRVRNALRIVVDNLVWFKHSYPENWHEIRRNKGHPYNIASQKTREEIVVYFALQMRQWAYISDEEALQIARQLLLDTLEIAT